MGGIKDGTWATDMVPVTDMAGLEATCRLVTPADFTDPPDMNNSHDVLSRCRRKPSLPFLDRETHA